jgi:8-oxo-dGTP pyrophosphatase MutT (NUDIX family)
MTYNKTLIYRAGLIPYYLGEDGAVRMLFMKPSDPEYGGDTFQIAKGKVEEDDANHQAAALREAKEEIGLFVGNVIKTEEVGTFMGRTTIFVSKIKDPTMFGEPSFETGDVSWMTLEEFMDIGRDLHKPVVQASYRLIERLEDL